MHCSPMHACECHASETEFSRASPFSCKITRRGESVPPGFTEVQYRETQEKEGKDIGVGVTAYYRYRLSRYSTIGVFTVTFPTVA